MSTSDSPLHTIAVGPELIAVVPAARLSWHQTTLPAGALGRSAARSRLRAVLEGLLEEQLLDEPAQMHFALQPEAQPGKPVWVAVCERSWLRDALASLERSGHSPNRVVPAWSPGEGGALWLLGSDDAPEVLWTDARGVHVRPVAAGARAADLVPAQVLQQQEVFAEPAVAAWAERWLQRPVRVQTPPEQWLQAARSAWDLAQFELARRNPVWQRIGLLLHSVATSAAWRPARWAAVALVAIQIAGLNLWAWRAAALEQAQRDAIRGVLQTSFPAVTVVIDPVLQMQRQVQSLRRQGGALGAGDLEAQLAALGSDAARTSGVQPPTAIDFSAGESRVQGTAVAPERQDALNQALAPQGLAAQIDGSGVRVQARSAP